MISRRLLVGAATILSCLALSAVSFAASGTVTVSAKGYFTLKMPAANGPYHAYGEATTSEGMVEGRGCKWCSLEVIVNSGAYTRSELMRNLSHSSRSNYKLKSEGGGVFEFTYGDGSSQRRVVYKVVSGGVLSSSIAPSGYSQLLTPTISLLKRTSGKVLAATPTM